MSTYIYKDELYHHGIKGQKWGIRRYQNFDGSYTQAGLKRYYKSEEAYNEAKSKYKTTKANYKAGKATKYDVNVSKNQYKDARRRMNKDYRHLREDKLGDQGKRLYAQGKRITSNAQKALYTQIGVSVAASFASKYANEKVAAIVAGAGTAINIGMTAVNAYQNRRLRAYYGHTSKY